MSNKRNLRTHSMDMSDPLLIKDGRLTHTRKVTDTLPTVEDIDTEFDRINVNSPSAPAVDIFRSIVHDDEKYVILDTENKVRSGMRVQGVLAISVMGDVWGVTDPEWGRRKQLGPMAALAAATHFKSEDDVVFKLTGHSEHRDMLKGLAPLEPIITIEGVKKMLFSTLVDTGAVALRGFLFGGHPSRPEVLGVMSPRGLGESLQSSMIIQDTYKYAAVTSPHEVAYLGMSPPITNSFLALLGSEQNISDEMAE